MEHETVEIDEKDVVISVSGGVAEVVSKPEGARVLIFDYDVDGGSNLDEDEFGEACRIAICE